MIKKKKQELWDKRNSMILAGMMVEALLLLAVIIYFTIGNMFYGWITLLCFVMFGYWWIKTLNKSQKELTNNGKK